MDIVLMKNEILKAAKDSGFQDCEVYYEGGKSFEVMIYEGEIAHYENSAQKGLSFRGRYQGKMGYAYTEKIDLSVIPFLLEEAKENASIIEEETEELLYPGENIYPQVEGYAPQLAQVTAEEKIEAAKAMERAARQEDSAVENVDYCLTGYGESTLAIANTKGLDVSYRSNMATGYISVIASRDGSIKTGGEYWVGSRWEDFDGCALGKAAAKEATSHLGASTIVSGVYQAALKNSVMADLLATFSGVFFGENAQKGFSLLKEKQGQQIASQVVTLRDDGLYENGYATAPFDSEGVACKNKAVIENGVLKTLLYNLKTAKIDGVDSTGNGFKASYKSPVLTACTNFYLEKGAQSPEELLKEMNDGILITEVAGLHSGANSISGDFSLSAEGFLVKNGVVDRPIEQITIAGNFYQLLKDIVKVADDLRFNMPTGNGAVGSPMVLVSKLHISGGGQEEREMA